LSEEERNRLRRAEAALEGSATTPAGKALNRLKNRTSLPTEKDIDPKVSLREMLAPGPDLERFDETKAGRIVGLVINVKLEGVTSANFHSKKTEERGTLIELGLTEDAPPRHRVIAVVT